MDVVLSFLVLGCIVFLGFGAEHLFRRTKIPDIILLILLGVVFGYFFDINNSPVALVAPLFTTFALLFILFEGALRLKVTNLVRQLTRSIALSVFGFLLTVGATYAVARALGFTHELGLLLGFILGGTSSSIVIPLVKHLNLSKETTAIVTLESAFTDVLCIVCTVVATQAFALQALEPGAVLGSLASKLLVAGALGTGAGFAWVFALRRWKTANSYVLTIASLLILYACVEYLGANGAVACLAFGVVLGNARRIPEQLHAEDARAGTQPGLGGLLSQQQLTVYAEVSFFVKTFFFVYLGTLIDFSSAKPFVLAAVITIAIFATRPIAVWISRAGQQSERGMVEAMFPKGLAAAVLASVPLQAGIPGADALPSVVLATVLFSIIVCSVAVFSLHRGWFNGLYRARVKRR